MSATKDVKFDESKDLAKYVAFKNHLGPGVPHPNSYQKSLGELIEGYDGSEIYLDFNQESRLNGIEILGD